MCYNADIMKTFIILDLEWNQSPSGKEGTVEHLPFEIIEIGAVKLDGHFRMMSEFRRLVRPITYTELHYKILEVVHTDMEELQERGSYFPDAFEDFREWCGDDFVFCIWGSMDLTELQRNLAYFHMGDPLPKPLLYYDIQKLYSLLYKDGKEKVSLDTAVQELGITQDRPFHQAMDDAYYTGRVMGRMDWKKVEPFISVDYYRPPKNREEEITLKFPGYTKFVSKAFDTKEDALADKKVSDMICGQCRRMLHKKIRWFQAGQKIYLCLAVCPEHGLVKGKIRIKKAEDGSTFIVKTMKPINEEQAEEIIAKREESRKKRQKRNLTKKNAGT